MFWNKGSSKGSNGNDAADVPPEQQDSPEGARSRASPYSIDGITRVTEDKLARFSTLGKGAMDNAKCDWEPLVQEGDLTLFRRPAAPGAVSNFDTYQLRATTNGITAKEICEHFWDVKYRLDWEVSIDVPPTLLTTTDEHTVVLHQIFKTIWPAKLRYTTFWSRFLPLPVPESSSDSSSGRIVSKYCVINYSVDYPLDDPELSKTSSKSIFALLDVILVCETRVKSGSPSAKSTDPKSIRREDLVTDIAYICCIDPGGWAPVSVARLTAKKEYPRFIRRLTKYVHDKCAKLAPNL